MVDLIEINVDCDRGGLVYLMNEKDNVIEVRGLTKRYGGGLAVDGISFTVARGVRQAQRNGDRQHVLNLLHVLHHFLKTHPEAELSQHAWS